MNCSTHTEAPAVAFCRTCGKALCADCRRVTEGVVYCADHATAPASAGASPYFTTPPTPPGHANPGLAFVLGLIPGVGAIYNGQYAKGLVHAIIFGTLISIIDSHSAHGAEPLFGILIAAFVPYMAFEAHHTARRRNAGEKVEEFSGLSHARPGGSSSGAMALIVIGAVFLLNTLGILEMHQILRFWPVLLIALGVSMLHSRISEPGGTRQSHTEPNREVNHERQ